MSRRQILEKQEIPEEDDREPQPSDGPDYHADHASWEQRRTERQRRTHVPARVPE